MFFIYQKSYAYVYWHESLPEAVIFLLLSLVLNQILLVIKSYVKRKMSLFYCAIQRTQIMSWITTTSDLLNLGAFTKITKSINQSFEEAPLICLPTIKFQLFQNSVCHVCAPNSPSKLLLFKTLLCQKKRKSRKLHQNRCVDNLYCLGRT